MIQYYSLFYLQNKLFKIIKNITLNMITERIENKIKIFCKDRKISTLIPYWLLNGTYKDKEDAYTIVNNLKDSLRVLNGISSQIYSTITPEQIKDDLYAEFKSIISQKEKIGKTDSKNNKDVEIRGWIFPLFAKCANIKNTDECYNILVEYLDEKIDILSRYWSFLSLVEYLEHLDENKKKKKIEDMYKKENARETKNRIYWFLLTWKINNENNSVNEIQNLIESNINKDEIFECINSLSYYPSEKTIPTIKNYFEKEVNKDFKDFFSDKDIPLYKSLISCVIEIANNKYKGLYKESQEYISILCFRFLSQLRNYSNRIYNEIRLLLLKAIRRYYRITDKKVIDELRNELFDFGIGICCEAIKTSELIHGPENLIKMIVKTLNDKKKNTISVNNKVLSISYGLKLISNKNKEIITSLDKILQNSDDHDEKNIARVILTEMGGYIAINKIKETQSMRDKYMEMTGHAQKQIENMFEKSITEAKNGFKVSLYMNIAVFILGFILIAISGFMAVFRNEEDEWVGVGVSSGAGTLSMMYSLFFNKPSRKIRKSTNHLMRLKVIFLGYLRELTQLDQTFSKRLLDLDPITMDDLELFINKISKCMKTSLSALQFEETLHNNEEGDNKDKIKILDDEEIGIKIKKDDEDKEDNIRENINKKKEKFNVGESKV